MKKTNGSHRVRTLLGPAILGSFVACNHAAGVASTSRDAPPAATPPAGSRGAGWSVSKTYRYEASLESQAEALGNKAFEFSLTSELEVVPVEVSHDGAKLAMHLLRPRLRHAGSDDPRLSRLLEELARPWGLELKGGHADTEWFARGLSAQAVGVLRTVASAYQYAEVAPSGPPVLVHEFDSSGEYEVEYRRSGGALEKRKVRYLGLQIAGAIDANRRAMLTPEVAESKGTVRLSDGVLSEFASSERLRSALAADRPLVSTTTVHLRLSSVAARAGVNWDELMAGAVATLARDTYGTPARRDAFDDLVIGNTTVEEAISRIRAAMVSTPSDAAARGSVPKSTEFERDRLQAFSALAALVRKDANALVKIVRLARGDGPLPPKVLFDVLASAGTPEAQRALCDIIVQKTTPPPRRAEAAFSLIRVREATPETVTLLEHLATDPTLQEHGIYGLGTAARRLREAGNADAAAKIAGTLSTILANAQTEGMQMRALRGIANSADAHLLLGVKPFLSGSPSFGVRQAAAEALEHMDHPDVDVLLADRIARDMNELVRGTAASVAGMRTASPALMNALTTAATGDSDRGVRYESVRALARWAPEHEPLRSVLETVANREQEPQIRQLARAAAGKAL